MPQLGESVTEGTISKWLVSVGDKVNKYDPIAEVMTDKVNAEVPSSFSGIIKELVAEEGDTLAVGEAMCSIEVSDTADLGLVAMDAAPVIENAENVSETQAANKSRFSPAVLKLSSEHGIDLSQVIGSGAGGRITRKDILAIIESGHIAKVDEKAVIAEQKATAEAVK